MTEYRILFDIDGDDPHRKLWHEQPTDPDRAVAIAWALEDVPGITRVRIHPEDDAIRAAEDAANERHAIAAGIPF